MFELTTLNPFFTGLRADNDFPFSFRNIDRLFGFDDFPEIGFKSFGTDIKDNGDAFVAATDLPGFNKEDISVNISGDTLTVSAKRDSNDDKNSKNGYIRCERRSSYERSFDISEIDAEKITAKYENGVLTLNLPKKEPASATAKTVTVE